MSESTKDEDLAAIALSLLCTSAIWLFDGGGGTDSSPSIFCMNISNEDVKALPFDTMPAISERVLTSGSAAFPFSSVLSADIICRSSICICCDRFFAFGVKLGTLERFPDNASERISVIVDINDVFVFIIALYVDTTASMFL